MACIRTSSFYSILVDDADLPIVQKYTWHVCKRRQRIYAKANIIKNGKRTTAYMHRILLPWAKEIDHIDGNGLNNHRNNLREVTRRQNLQNKRKTSGSSKFKGVSYCSSTGTWQVHIRANNRNIALGRFVNEEDAAKTYDTAARKYFGEFARTNF